MASPNDGNTGCVDTGGKEVIKSQFVTREGIYKQMTLSEYSRPSRVSLNSSSQTAAAAAAAAATVGGNVAANFSVRVSFITLPPEDNCSSTLENRERICFNVGRELYVYNYEGVSKAADLSRPIDKRIYKGTYPTCHDFNQAVCSADYCELLIGFSAGQIQLINPFKRENQVNRLFNEDRQIDKTRVTCLNWVPGSKQHFLAAHASGHLYVYNTELTYACSFPSYQLFKLGEGYAIHICKTKSSRNPVYRWTVGEGAINEFEFSPDGRQLAVVNEDGYLRIFDYNTMELTGLMRSYFGGLLCVAWSPDARYIATGGEDDLVSIYSVNERRAVCRGQGHRSWVSKVAFDPYASQVISTGSILHLDSEEDLRLVTNSNCHGNESAVTCNANNQSSSHRSQRLSTGSISSLCGATYRFGSVGHDTLLCLWDLSEDELRPAPCAQSVRAANLPAQSQRLGSKAGSTKTTTTTGFDKGVGMSMSFKGSAGEVNSVRSKRLLINLTHAGSNSNSGKNSSSSGAVDNNTLGSLSTCFEKAATLGSPMCPYLNDIPMIQPLLSKKIAHERLSVILFRPDSIVTACQEGFICTWARPGRCNTTVNQTVSQHNSPSSVDVNANAQAATTTTGATVV